MADAADLKSASRKGVGVRIPSWAPVYSPYNRECGARSRSREKFEPGTESALGQCAAAL